MKETIELIKLNDIDNIEKILFKLRKVNTENFNKVIDKMKVIFISSDKIELLNKISLVFSTFKIHSSVPIIMEKLLSEKYNQNGGTLVYSLTGLKRNNFKHELIQLKKKKISFEMKQMLAMLGY
jgi:hypothetical protein